MHWIISLLILITIGTAATIFYRNALQYINPFVLSGGLDPCGRIDIDSNNTLDIIDLANLAKKYNTACDDTAYIWGCRSIDTDNNNIIDSTDLNYILNNYENGSCILGNQYYASPTGSPSGDGSINNPWDLATAFSMNGIIQPGSTLWLRGGTYGTGGSTYFKSTLVGTEAAPIVIRSYPGEWAVINGGVQSYNTSAWNWHWGYEITNTLTARTVSSATQDRREGLDLLSRGDRAINMVINNAGHPAIGFWEPIMDGGTAYGNIVWGNGIYDTADSNRNRGAAIYAQNETGNRYIKNNVLFSNLSTGVSTHGLSGSVKNFTIQNNTVFNNGDSDFITYTSATQADNMIYDSNYLYGYDDVTYGGVDMGYVGSQLSSTFTNNIFYHADKNFFAESWDSITLNNNKFITNTTFIDKGDYINNFIGTNNQFYGGGGIMTKILGVAYKKFSDLATLISDDGSNIHKKSYPTQNYVFVRSNEFEHSRAFATIYNWENKQSESINPSAFLSYGDKYVIRDVLNYHTPIYTGTYLGGNITLPLDLYKYEPLVGQENITNIQIKHTAPLFNTFSIERIINNDSYIESVSPVFVNTLNPAFGGNITLSTATLGAEIYYTTDGSDPTTSSNLYTGAITINNLTDLRVFAVKSGYSDSVKLKYSIEPLDLSYGLIANLSFEDSDPSVFINSAPAGSNKLGNGANMNQAAVQVDGPVGKALSLNGTNSYVTLSEPSNITNFTFSLLVKMDASETSADIMGDLTSTNKNFLFELVTASLMRAHKYSGAGNTPSSVNITNFNDITEWNHYVVTYDGTNMKVYINGLLKSTTLCTDPSVTNLKLVTLGKGYSSDYVYGFMDEFKAYSRALNKDEIKALYSLYDSVI